MCGGTHAGFKHSSVFVCICVCVWFRKQCWPQCPPMSPLRLLCKDSHPVDLSPGVSNLKQQDLYQTPHLPFHTLRVILVCTSLSHPPTAILSIDGPKGLGVNLFPSLAFVETIWPTFWFQTHSWDLAPSFLGTMYSGNSWLYSISQKYISVEFFDWGKCDFKSKASGRCSQQIKFIAMRNTESQGKAEMSVSHHRHGAKENTSTLTAEDVQHPLPALV